MIVNCNRNPRYSLYFLGAIIIKKLKEKEMTIELLWKEINQEYDEDISIDFIYYSLDWLFLIDVVRLEKNKVILC